MRLKVTIQVADLRPTAFILWYIYIYTVYVLAERFEKNRFFDLVNAHRAATVWNNVRLKLTLQVANLKPTAFILWYIYICLMFC